MAPLAVFGITNDGLNLAVNLLLLFLFVLWLALVFIPIWFYLEYIAPVMQGMLSAYEQVQTTNAAAQAQLGQFAEPLEKLRALMGGE